MTATRLPPLMSSDGHLEVRPERWSGRVPKKFAEVIPRTVKMPDGGDAILVPGQPPYPAPFLDLRAGRTNETWMPFGVTLDDTAGVGPPEQRLQEQDADGMHAEVLFPNMQVGPRLWRNMTDDDAYRAVVRAYNDWLGEDYWGRGIATDALRGFVPYVFETFALTRLFATTFAHHRASQRVLEKAGFTLEAILRRAAIKRGEVHDMALYGFVHEAPG